METLSFELGVNLIGLRDLPVLSELSSRRYVEAIVNWVHEDTGLIGEAIGNR